MTLTRRGLLAGSLAATSAGRLGRPAMAAETDLSVEVVDGTLPLRPDGPPTPVLRYGSAQPALVLRARQGEMTALRIRNRLAGPTSIRLCGLRGQGSLDDVGTVAGATIAGGTEAVVQFTPTDSGTAWFRPVFDAVDQTGRGLAGVLIVEPATEGPTVDQDLVLMLRDWRLDAQNRLAPDAATAATVITLGNQPLPSALTGRPGARLRLRLVNASTDRIMVVACEGAKPLIVAIDGQPSELFQPIRDTVPIGPGARFDLMLDLPRSAGQTLRLVLRGTETTDGHPEPDRLLATVTTAGEALAPRPPITPLPPNPALPSMIPLERAKRAELTIDQAGPNWTVNGISGRELPKRPVLRVKQGDAVTLGFTNASRILVPLSLTGQAVRLLHPNDDGWEPYWRDTVLLPSGSRNHVAFLATTPGRWPIESGFSAQAVAGLRCWFEVAKA